MSAWDWIKSNPLVVAGGVFFVGLVFLLSRGGGNSAGDGGAGAFYAAQAASKTSGDQVLLAQIAANAQTAQSTAYFQTQKEINSMWAGNQLSLADKNNAAAVALAPFNLRALYLQTTAEIARIPPVTQTTTSSKSKSGFFGIGGGTKTSTQTTVIPNPAWDFLSGFDDFFDDMLNPPPGG